MTVLTDINTVTLYAQWRPFGFEDAFAFKGKVKQSNYYKMQDMTPEICNLVKIASDNSTATLIDTRDSNTYTVAKLKDNRCWMTQNLRITGSRTLTSNDSDVSSNFNLPASSPSGFTSPNWNVAYVYIYQGNGYYSWYAATAGTGIASMTPGQDAKSSICPKGWKLPTKRASDSGSYGEYDILSNAYNNESAKLTASPANFVLGGSYYNGNPPTIGNSGFYWPSSAHGTYNANYDAKLFYITTTEAGGDYVNATFRGNSVRCMAKY